MKKTGLTKSRKFVIYANKDVILIKMIKMHFHTP